MKIRLGPGQDNLYIQLGDEPSDDDEHLGEIYDPTRARFIVDILNGDAPPFTRE